MQLTILSLGLHNFKYTDAILHISAARAKHTHTHVRLYSVILLFVQWVVIGQYAMGRSITDGSIVSLVSTCMTKQLHISPRLYNRLRKATIEITKLLRKESKV